MSKKLSESDIEELKMSLGIEGQEILLAPYQLFRLSSQQDGRYYWEMNEDGTFSYYASVTTVIGETSNPKYLTEWRIELGKEESELIRDSSAEYGTCMHALFTHFLICGSFRPDFLPIWLDQYCEVERPKYRNEDWPRKLRRDLAAWMQFCHDYNLRPIAIEVILRSRRLRMAGAIDLICELDIHEKGFWGETLKSGENKGEPKKTTKIRRGLAIVDWKSGRKDFYRSHEVQLEGYNQLVAENFPNLNVEKLINWSPKDWRTEPSYNEKDQTGLTTPQSLLWRSNQFWDENGDIATRREVIGNPIWKLGESAVGVLKSVSLQEYMEKWHKKEQVAEMEAETANGGGGAL